MSHFKGIEIGRTAPNKAKSDQIKTEELSPKIIPHLLQRQKLNEL